MSAYPPRNLADLRPQTRAERSGFTETSRHADVIAFIDSLKAMSPLIHVATFGRSAGGRDIPMVVVARPVVRSAAEARRLGRPIVYVQGNIHGGEVEGKEASLSLLRDLVFDRYANVLDSLVLVVVPIYNADGNDSLGPQLRNRGSQNGPELVGQRPNGQGLDLNRDYIKAEAPETRASLDFFREWDPDVFVDLHTTNGSYHGYALTWAPPLNPAALISAPFTRDTVLPDIRARLRSRLRIQTYPYGNFLSQDSVERGWSTYDHRPRFGTNYYGLRGRVAVLSEAYSHDPFRQRISSTYGFVYELLSFIAEHGEDFVETARMSDTRTTGYAAVSPANSPRIAIRSRLTTSPRMDEVLVEDLIRTGDSVRYEAGLRPGIRRSGRVRPVRMPVYDRFEPELEQSLPWAWIIPAEQATLLEPLRRNGVFIEQLSSSVEARVERFVVDSISRGRPFQGHRETSLTGRWEAPTTATIDSTAYIIRAGQPLGILALYLLEPQSDDGLVTWNFLDPWLQPGNRYPIARVVERVAVPLRPAR